MITHRIKKADPAIVTFPDRILEKINTLLKQYPEGKQKSALLPVLHLVQEENGGYLSVNTMNAVASHLKILPVEVYEVATFYSMFNLDPVGKYVIEVCRTGPCAFCGGEKILNYLKKKLNIDSEETTSDGVFTLREVECLGACGSAPVLQVNTEFYESLTEKKIDSIIDSLKEKVKSKQNS